MHDAVMVLDPASQTLLAVNDRACEMYGLPREGLVGFSIKSFSKDAASRATNIRDTLAAATFHEFETVHYRSDGSQLLVDIRATPIDFDGRRAILSFVRDVTERATLLRGIEASRDEWQQTFDAMDEAIILLDREQRVLRANRRSNEMSGDRHGAMEGSFLTAFSHAQPWRKASELVSELLSGGGSSGQITDVDGRTWDISAASVQRNGDAGNIVVIARDITGIVSMEASLRSNETMAEMGVLIGGVAHEVRNPLFAISATADGIDARFTGDDPVMKQYLVNLRQEMARLNKLMQDLLDYGRPPSVDVHVATLSEVASVAIRRVRKQAEGRGVEIVNEMPADSGRALIDIERLSAALENLLKNAIAHSPSGKQVFVRGGSSESEHGKKVWCRVQDQGNGFHPDNLPHIFEPFYSRRPGGTGLGLPIVKRIVDFHGGQVIAENGPGGGASMTIVLPAYLDESCDGA